MLLIRSLGRRLASTDAPRAATTTAPLEVTRNQLIDIKDSCLNRLKQILERPQEEFLRIHVETGGCSGFSYMFEIENKPIDPEEDLVFERDNYRVVINRQVLPFMKGSAIEYNETLIKSSFHVANPVAQTNCGCGSSFSVDLNKLERN